MADRVAARSGLVCARLSSDRRPVKARDAAPSSTDLLGSVSLVLDDGRGAESGAERTWAQGERQKGRVD